MLKEREDAFSETEQLVLKVQYILKLAEIVKKLPIRFIMFEKVVCEKASSQKSLPLNVLDEKRLI